MPQHHCPQVARQCQAEQDEVSNANAELCGEHVRRKRVGAHQRLRNQEGEVGGHRLSQQVDRQLKDEIIGRALKGKCKSTRDN